MREILERAYDESPYPDYAFWFTHPDHMGALGTLFGVSSPPIASCSVLEIGCASGGNILSIASSLPGSRCVGIDLSSVQIARARAHAEGAGITNISFFHGDFRELPKDLGTFDFVIVHGVYSWVDDDTAHALLLAVRERLNPLGIAYVSYNTYPGWHMVDMVRKLMRLHTADAPSDDEKLEQSVQITRWLHRRTRMNPNDWRGRALEQELQAMNDAGRSLMLHDYLAVYNRPLYFLDFIDNAAKAGLSYLANASPWDMYVENYDDDLSDTLRQLPDLLLQQQYLDFAQHTRFRRTLLCRDDAPATRDVRAEVTTSMFMSTGMFEEPGLDGIEVGIPIQVKVNARPSLTVANPILRVALQVIWKNGRRAASFEELVMQTLRGLSELGLEPGLVSSPDAPERIRGRLAGQLLRTFFADAVKYGVARPPIAMHIPERPATGRFQRYMAKHFDYSPNLWHEHFPLGEASRAVMQGMDGTRTLEQLQELHPAPILETVGNLRHAGFILHEDDAAGRV